MNDEEKRAERYHEMHVYQGQQLDMRGCLHGGPNHPNQYFHRERGYWICPDCGDTSRKGSLRFVGSVFAMVLAFFMVFFLVAKCMQ